MPRHTNNPDTGAAAEHERRVLALVADIRRYLGTNPDARADLHEVKKMWLDSELFAPDTSLVATALERMLRARQLSAERIDDATIYSVGAIP